MRHLNSFLAQGRGHLNKTFPKIQMTGGGMLKLHFDWYITARIIASLDYISAVQYMIQLTYHFVH